MKFYAHLFALAVIGSQSGAIAAKLRGAGPDPDPELDGASSRVLKLVTHPRVSGSTHLAEGHFVDETDSDLEIDGDVVRRPPGYPRRRFPAHLVEGQLEGEGSGEGPEDVADPDLEIDGKREPIYRPRPWPKQTLVEGNLEGEEFSEGLDEASNSGFEQVEVSP